MSFTVVPLHNLNFLLGSPIAFGDGFVIEKMPEWVKKDEFILNRLSAQERESIIKAKYAFVARYKASSIGEDNPSDVNNNPMSIQVAKSEVAILANLALWLVQPSATRFTTLFHAISRSLPGQTEDHPIIQLTETRQPLFCHPDDLEKKVSINQAEEAGKLHARMISEPRRSAVWVALRSVWGALTSPVEDIRYSLFWVGLESLLGPDGSGEIVYKLSQRIAFLISSNTSEAIENFRKAKDCYNTRSKIVHGRWASDPKMLLLMANTETIVRSVLLRVLNDTVLLKEFTSTRRDKFLEEMVFSGFGTISEPK